MTKIIAAFVAAALLCTLSAATAQEAAPALTLIGHAHLMIITAEGTVVYIDPTHVKGYAYEHDADIILVSHEHPDHNEVKLVPQADDCQILRIAQTINADGTYNSFTVGEVTVTPVPAQNKNHNIKKTNGYIIQFDGITVYFASDTSKLESMANLRQYNVDYAFFPIDGQYNMGPAEAMECAALVGARHNTPIHWFNANPEQFTPENLLFMDYGDTITLEQSTEE